MQPVGTVLSLLLGNSPPLTGTTGDSITTGDSHTPSDSRSITAGDSHFSAGHLISGTKASARLAEASACHCLPQISDTKDDG